MSPNGTRQKTLRCGTSCTRSIVLMVRRALLRLANCAHAGLAGPPPQRRPKPSPSRPRRHPKSNALAEHRNKNKKNSHRPRCWCGFFLSVTGLCLLPSKLASVLAVSVCWLLHSPNMLPRGVPESQLWLVLFAQARIHRHTLRRHPGLPWCGGGGIGSGATAGAGGGFCPAVRRERPKTQATLLAEVMS